MQESMVLEKLEKIDKELHSVMNELRVKKSKKSLEEIRELFSSNLVSDEDPTKLIREMRDKKYDL